MTESYHRQRVSCNDYHFAFAQRDIRKYNEKSRGRGTARTKKSRGLFVRQILNVLRTGRYICPLIKKSRWPLSLINSHCKFSRHLSAPPSTLYPSLTSCPCRRLPSHREPVLTQSFSCTPCTCVTSVRARLPARGNIDRRS